MPLTQIAENYSLQEIAAAITHVGLTTTDPGVGASPNPGGVTDPTNLKHVHWGPTPIANSLAANAETLTWSGLPVCTLLYVTFWFRRLTYFGYTYYGAGELPPLYLGFAPVGAGGPHSFDTATVATDGTFTSPRHRLVDGALVRLGTVFDRAMPGAYQSGPLYVVANSTTDTFQVTVDEQQTVTISGDPTGGTFTLAAGGAPTVALAPDASAPTIKAALETLTEIGEGNVEVTVGAGADRGWTVRFIGDLAGVDVPQLTAVAGLTGGTAPAVHVSTTADGAGVPTLDEGATVFWQQVVPVSVAGSFELGVGQLSLSARGF